MPSGDKWAVLFDLDETLVLSAALESLRRAGDWPKVYAAFGMTTLPPGTVEALGSLNESKHTLGVVTKSPRTYAERLIRHHALGIPVLVAYHDVKLRKPQGCVFERRRATVVHPLSGIGAR